MPARLVPFRNENIYHVYDKTVDSIRIFSTDNVANRFLNVLAYYRSANSTMRYSYLKGCREVILNQILNKTRDKESFQVQLLAYCLMPNHYHLLVKQVKLNGIETMMRKSLNSITRLYNTIYDRKGPVFLTQFKAKRVRSEEQLVFVSRYIHTNSYTSGLVTQLSDIYTYRFSSIHAYVKEENPYQIDTNEILNSAICKGQVELYKKYINSLSLPK